MNVEKNENFNSFENNYRKTSEVMRSLYHNVRDYILSRGDDVAETHRIRYVAFKRNKNMVCALIHQSKIILCVSIDAKHITFEEGFSRNMTGRKRGATGSVELTIKTTGDFEKAKPIIDRAYIENK